MTRQTSVRRLLLLAMIVVVGLLILRDQGLLATAPADTAMDTAMDTAAATPDGPPTGHDPAARPAAATSAPTDGLASRVSDDELRAALGRRVARYLELRRADDWPGLYQLTDPQQRDSVSLARFLDYYGHGVLALQSIASTAVRCDPERRVAVVDLHSVARLVPERLPPRFRSGLRVEREEDLIRDSEYSQPWVWREGEWYFLMDQEFTTGVDAEGKPVSVVGAEG